MLEVFFIFLLFFSFFSLSVYSFYYEKKDFAFLLAMILSLIFLLKLSWYSSLISIALLILPVILLKRLSYTQLFCFLIFGSILFSYFLLRFFLAHEFKFLLHVATLTILFMCILAIIGIFEDELRKYLIYSNTIQLSFVFLDLAVAKLLGKISTLGTIQIFNYTLAGLLLFSSLGILSEDNKRKKISSLQGCYYKDKLNGTFASIAALSLAGIPGLNIFVSEWLLFKASFLINPILTVSCIFLALLLFIMYFKVVNVLLVGSFEERKISMRYITFLNSLLALVCLIFGLFPQAQLYILKKVL